MASQSLPRLVVAVAREVPRFLLRFVLLFPHTRQLRCVQHELDSVVPAQIGVFGELHPEVRSQYDWPSTFKAPVLAAELNLDLLIGLVPALYQTSDLPTFPPVLEDLALAVDENVPAVEIENLIRQTGGKLLTEVRLFDLFRSEQIGEGKKSLAYALTYQAVDRTLKDEEVKQLRGRIIRRLEHEFGAKLRS